MPPRTDIATHAREDISRFVIHLTRDDRATFSNGATPRKNFVSIVNQRRILATQPHCLFNHRLHELSDDYREQLNVACFTETPLTQLKHLVAPIASRKVQLASYGLVFTKDFIVQSGGQPALYINSYADNRLRESVQDIFRLVSTGNKRYARLSRLLPFINAMHANYDLSWEREWRVSNTVHFKKSDIVCFILPETGEEKLANQAAELGVAVISPGWTYEQIVSELARQQRVPRKLRLGLG